MMYWVIHILIVGMISLLFYRQFHADFPGWIYWSSLLLKLAAGVVVGLIFFHHYEMGDTIVFFNEAVEIARAACIFRTDNMWENPQLRFHKWNVSHDAHDCHVEPHFGSGGIRPDAEGRARGGPDR